MTLVVNSGPLISLARIGRLDLLPALFDEVVAPRAVFEEVTRDPKLPGAAEIAKAAWLRIIELADRDAVDRLQVWLDAGESEVLVLARDMKGTAAIDERRGRALASALGVPQTGTVGILILAKRRGLIPALTPLLDELGARGIHLSSRLYDDARRLVGELRRDLATFQRGSFPTRLSDSIAFADRPLGSPRSNRRFCASR